MSCNVTKLSSCSNRIQSACRFSLLAACIAKIATSLSTVLMTADLIPCFAASAKCSMILVSAYSLLQGAKSLLSIAFVDSTTVWNSRDYFSKESKELNLVLWMTKTFIPVSSNCIFSLYVFLPLSLAALQLQPLCCHCGTDPK